jgi:hypothetical protein
MSDIDFDELDKAVNTLMGGVPKVAPVKTDDVKTLTIASTIPDDTPPSLAKLDSTIAEVNAPVSAPVEAPAAATTTPARTVTPPLANRRGGRFMDVVHPSNVKSGPKLASRVGVTITPASMTPPEKTSNSVVEEKSYADTSNVNGEPSLDAAAPSVAPDAVPASTDWPDPLDMSGYHNEPDTSSNEAVAVESVTTVPSVSVDLEQDDVQSPSSPFIAHDKEQTRPLGGAPLDTPHDEPTPLVPTNPAIDHTEETPLEEDTTDQLPVDPSAQEIHLPPELQSDLMAIETDGDTSPAGSVQRPPSIATEVQKTESNPEVVVATSPKTDTTVASAAPSGPTSIPQQYHEVPSTSDTASGSIYDTDSYHQPLAHPAKTKSGWLWIIWILLLLLVGGGGAVALYFIGII